MKELKWHKNKKNKDAFQKSQNRPIITGYVGETDTERKTPWETWTWNLKFFRLYKSFHTDICIE